jgi:acetyltransferase-like isoleucine patch superfamily enzyme
MNLIDKVRTLFILNILRLKGSKIGDKVKIGKNVSFLGGPFEIGDNVVFEDNVRIKCMNYSRSKNTYNLKIERDVFIGYGTIIDCNLNVRIDRNVMIGPYCFITDSNHVHHLNDSVFRLEGGVYKAVRVFENTWIGSHTIILPGSEVQKNNVIAANSVVRTSTESNGLYAGTPVKRKK